MADRTISVILRAQTADFNREIGRATNTLDELVKRQDKHGTVADSTAGKIVQSARLQGDMWATVGSTLAGAGAGVTALNVAVAKTGIEYNTLQQTSRAALTSILRGSAQANAQMDKLDAFARTSPFSKAVFIQAQQQMLGFGIEARRVVPYLSAINEAVAATGGSNQDIAELSRIFSQVQAAAKITATDLMQFGQRGIDAATLIGSQMGKTGQQIREEITDGTLDAQVALDALAAGMTERFEGASAGVKNTMTGAVDRVKAAWRDLSASLMEGAVGSQGGGWLVGLTNQVADMIRMMERAPQPLKDFAFGLSVLGGGALLAGGGLMAFLPRAVETITAFQQMRQFAQDAGLTFKGMGERLKAVDWKATAADVGRFAAAVGIAAGIIGSLSAAMAIQNAEMDRLAPSAERVRAALQELASGRGGASINETFRTSAGYARDLGEALDVMERAYSKNADGASKFGAGLMNVFSNIIPGARSATDAVSESLGRIDAELASMSTEDAIAAWRQLDKQWGLSSRSAETLVASFPELAARIQEMANDVGYGVLTTEELADAMGGRLPAAMQSALSPMGAVSAELERQGQAAKDAQDKIGELADTQLALSGSAIGVETAIRAANEAVQKNGATLDIATEAGAANKASLDRLAAAARKQSEDQRRAHGDAALIDSAMARNRDSYVKVAQQMGLTADEAALLADSVGLIPGSAVIKVSAPGAKPSAAEVEDLRRRIESLPAEKRAQIAAIFQTVGYEAARNAYDHIRPKTVPIIASFSTRGASAVANRAGGWVAGLAYGGKVAGTAPHDRADNVLVAMTPGEWGIQKPTARHYGDSIMADFNAARFARADLQALQRLAYGGPVNAWQYQQPHMTPASSVTAPVSVTMPSGAAISRGDMDYLAAQIGRHVLAGADRVAGNHVASNARSIAAAGVPR